MSRFVTLRLVLALGMAGALSIGYFRLGAQQTPETPPQLTIDRVKEDLYNISGDGGNVGVLVTKDGAILVDDKFARDYDEILNKVKSVTSLPVRYILNTHHHGDHTGGNERFLAQAEIIAHKNARANIVTFNQPGPQRITFTEETAVWLGGQEVRMRYFGRGHTNGDAVVYFPALKVVHTGDLFVPGGPFIDYKGGGSTIEWTKTLEGVLAWDFDTAIPGHGAVGTRADLEQHIRKLSAMRDRMSALVKRGVGRDQAGDQLKLDDLGWTMSPLLKSSMPSFYDEMASQK
jgi:glyoxylase-like metal-dependent hydrolase (beta-lactamase superfamily II)